MSSNNPELIIRESGVGEIQKIDIASYNVSFIVQAGWTNSCGRLHHAEILNKGSIYDIKVIACQSKDDVCLEVMSVFDATVDINVKLPGEYTFKFWQSDSSTVDTTLIIK